MVLKAKSNKKYYYFSLFLVFLQSLMVFLSNSFVFKENRLSSPGSRTPAKVPDRFFEEFDYERRLKKRKLKLLAATEEAFAHLARVSQERIKGIFSDF